MSRVQSMSFTDEQINATAIAGASESTGDFIAGAHWAIGALAALTSAPAEPPKFSCHLQRDYGNAPCASDCGKLRCMYPSAPAATPPAAGAIDARAQAQQFLDRGLADVQDEGGVNTYYSEEAVLECIAAALASRDEPPAAAGEALAVDRADAVNLARNMLTVRDCKGITTYGVRVLCEAVMTMDAALAATPAPEATDTVWCKYVAGIIETYVKQNRTDEDRETGIAKIIGRRLWSLASRAAPQASGDGETKGGA